MPLMLELPILPCRLDIGAECCCAVGTLQLFWLPMHSRAQVFVFVFKSLNGLGLSLFPPSSPSSLVI